MIVDGKSIAADVYSDISEMMKKNGQSPKLAVFTASPNAETRKYLDLKKAKAVSLGIELVVEEFAGDVSTETVVESVERNTEQYDGLVLQLPFPAQVDVEIVLSKIPSNIDVDAMNWDGKNETILPPVVGAIKEIAERYDVSFVGKKTVVIGKGRLVGLPAALWAEKQQADVVVIDSDTADAVEKIKEADIIISGAGVSGLLIPEKIKEGVVIFDAGTSEDGGMLKGDADPACADKAALFTPVPGGIGPITIAILLRNLVILAKR